MLISIAKEVRLSPQNDNIAIQSRMSKQDWCPDSQEAKETASSLKWDFILQKRLDTVVDDIRDIQDLLESLE